MNKIPLLDNACKELLRYGVFDARAKCKYLVKRYVLRQKAQGEDLIFWPTGLLAAGLWGCRKELSEVGEDADVWVESIDMSLAAYFGRWLKKGMPLAVLDDLLAGETLLNIYLEVRMDESEFSGSFSAGALETALDRLAVFAKEHPKDGTGSLIYRPAHGEALVFADGIGLACPFLYRYGEIFDKKEYKELAVLQIVNFLSYGMDGATGLPYHGYDGKDDCKYGIIGWGRAVGWLFRGMTGCMVSAYGRERLEASCIEFADAVVAYQRQDGYFSWQLEALEGPADTSATGMICAGLRQGIESGVFVGEKYENALKAGRGALERSIRGGAVYQCSAECEGFSCYPQRYGAYPWSLGPALLALGHSGDMPAGAGEGGRKPGSERNG